VPSSAALAKREMPDAAENKHNPAPKPAAK
jgi:hypothetical protein